MKAMTIYFDNEGGTVTKVTTTKEFNSQDDLMKADIYKDIRDIAEERRDEFWKKSVSEVVYQDHKN